jgi:hypothetical protein
MGAMSSRSIPDLSLEQPREPQLATLGWALRRAALGLLILFGTAALAAWLFHASIEPDGSQAAHSEYALPPN